MKNKIFIFLDSVAPKNRLQTEVMISNGYEPTFFVTKKNPRFHVIIKEPAKEIVLESGLFKRLKQVRTWFKKYKNNLHHIEVYPGGRFSFIYFLLARQYGIPTICAERGDLLYYHRKGYDRLARLSMWQCYKMADIVWYREPYMKAKLEKLNKNLFFIHNAVPMHDAEILPALAEKDITFLWLNRIIPERRFDWFIEALGNSSLRQTTNYLVGMSESLPFKKEQQFVIDNKPGNLVLSDFTQDPGAFYRRAKFFVLPADVVFANNALLEAMSYGVVPLISDQLGSSLIVEDGRNGFIFSHTKAEFEKAMLKALNLMADVYQQMSNAAVEKIKKEFSEEKYSRAICELYNRLES
jgi:glycosyltransferase involved in cell wall biosynthesis